MVKLGGIVGGILGLTIQLIFTEWIFVNTFTGNLDVVEVLIGVVLVVSGALAGSSLARRFPIRKAKRSYQ